MTRKKRLLFALATTGLVVAGVLYARSTRAQLPAGKSTAAKPNIIFILIDDMGYADLSCYGNTLAKTPNLDRLAAEGVRFTQFSVASPICSPSRTGLLTGRTPARFGITSYLASRKENNDRGIKNWLDPNAPTIAKALHAAGYATGHFGKWHMGGQRDVGDAPLITEYGFDASLTTFEGLGDRVLPMVDDRDGKGARKLPLGAQSEKLGRGNITWVDRARVTTAFADRAMQFMKDSIAAGKPFYVDVWPDDVHSPFFPTAAGRGDGSKKALYEGVVHETDEQLGHLIEFVRNDPKLRDNTLIVVASDNGPEPGAGSPGIFRGHKGNLYEGGFREPFMVWGPGLVKGGQLNEKTVVNSVDLMPSLLRIAGVPDAPDNVAGEDGEDLSPALLGKTQQARTKPIYWLRPPDRPSPEGQPNNLWPDIAMREGDWKLLVMEDGSRVQLHDLATDPSEKTNVAADHPDIVARMTKMALDWRKTLPVRPMHHTPQPGDVPTGKTSD